MYLDTISIVTFTNILSLKQVSYVTFPPFDIDNFLTFRWILHGRKSFGAILPHNSSYYFESKKQSLKSLPLIYRKPVYNRCTHTKVDNSRILWKYFKLLSKFLDCTKCLSWNILIFRYSIRRFLLLMKVSQVSRPISGKLNWKKLGFLKCELQTF